MAKVLNPEVGIIIRTKNEERWIISCLDALSNQTYKNYEIILVDNLSTDKTVEKAQRYGIKKIIRIKDYLPGKSLNRGIEHTKAKYIVCLSAHCLPIGENWLDTLVNSINENDDYAGVYGGQEPMSFSKPSDKRDLLLVFGRDRKIQVKDSFFHNANSIIRRDLWEKVPFDNETTNIEDRIWAQEMLNLNYKILYEPEARVYHYHGIHQDGDNKRLENVVRIIEERYSSLKLGQLDAEKLNIICIIPVKGNQRLINGKPQLSYTIDYIKNSKYVNDVFVATDNEETQKIALSLGAKSPFLRPNSLSEPSIGLEIVQQYALSEIEKTGVYPDLVVHMEETMMFRDEEVVDQMIIYMLKEGFDSVIAARRESGYLWKENDKGLFNRIDSGDIPREFKERSFIGLHGYGCITYPSFLRNQQLTGGNIGIYEVKSPLASFEVRDDISAELGSMMISVINKSKT